MHTFNAIQISQNVFWVGAIDWSLRDFHGYTTSRGSTYNAFLITGTTPILIDTVKAPFFNEMMERIKSVIEPEKIRYIISNHSEMDHTGSLPQTLAAIKPDKVFASKMGGQALNDHFHLDYPITEIKNGEHFSLGDANFVCLETRMLHWPDSMFTYFVNDKILFSQDGFGMHFATTKLFADQNDHAILRFEAAKYFANILLPYSNMVQNLLTKLPSYQLDIRVIAPDHGPLWRENKDIDFILNSWKKWSQQDYYAKAVIIYDTMWNSTATMAAAIVEGLMQENIATAIMPLSASNRSDIATELLEAGALIIGSPTLNQQMFPTVADALCYIKGLKPKNLVGQTFGSYGWNADALKLIQADLAAMQVELIDQPLGVKYVPKESDSLKCRVLGLNIAQALKNKL